MIRKLWSINKLSRSRTHAKRRIFAVLLSLVMCGTMIFGGAGAVFAEEGDWTAPTQTVAMGYSGSGSRTVTGTITQSSSVNVRLYEEYFDNGQLTEDWRQFNAYGFAYSLSLRGDCSYSIQFAANMPEEYAALPLAMNLYLLDSDGKYVAKWDDVNAAHNVVIPYTTGSGGGVYYLVAVTLSSTWSDSMGCNYSLSVGASDGTISGTISGTVSGGASLENVAVTSYRRTAFGGGRSDWVFYGETCTAPDGSYQLTGLIAGEYRIELGGKPTNYITNPNPNKEYIVEYYSTQENAYSIDSGTSIVLTTGDMAKPNINISLDRGSSISGRVTKQNGGIVNYGIMTTEAFPLGSSASRDFPYNSPNMQGYYTVWGLPVGTYVVTLQSGAPGALGIFASGTVSVTAPGEIVGVDIVLGNTSGGNTVYFDTRGGEAISNQTYYLGQTYDTLPTPTREGYTFDGWYYPIANGSVYGTKVTSSMPVRFSHTLYAHWTQLPPQQGSGDPPASDPSTPPASTVTGTPAPVADIPAAKAPTAPGGASQLPPSVIFADGTRANVAWSSSDSSVASIDSAGNLVAASEGTVTLTATATDGSGKTQTITVTIAKPVTKIRTPLEAIYLKSGASIALPLCADSLDASGKADTDAKLSYESANPKIATVDANGKITARKAGKTTVTVTALNGKSMKVKVNVTAKATPLKKFTIAKAPKTMKPGKAAQLKIKLTPAAATNLKVSFKSSKKGVATVDKAGKITAIKKGKTKITVKVGSKKIVLNITVK